MIATRAANSAIVGKIMGHRKTIDFNSVTHQIWMTGVEINSRYNDGFTQWGLKQDLLQIQDLLKTVLESTPKFEGEDEFVERLEADRVVRTLKK